MEEKTFNNIDYSNKTVSKPLPSKVNDIDTSGSFQDIVIGADENNKLDMQAINAFSNISRSRDQVYNLLDLMGEDPIISSALEIYTSDACEPNDNGQVVWCESDDDKCLNEVSQILDSLNVDKNSYSWVYSFIKYGDLYLRMYRNSEYNKDILTEEEVNNARQLHEDISKFKDKYGDQLTEDLILKLYSKNDHYAEYMEAAKNPAEVFNLTKFGKSCGYLKTHINALNTRRTSDLTSTVINQFTYNFEKNDVDIFGATEYVHACLEDTSDRTEEEVSVINTNGDEDSENNKMVYNVRRGKSILYDSFKVWRELSLLENSVLLNRLTKSAIVRIVSIETGDMEKTEAQAISRRLKSVIEQKSALRVDSSIQEYTNPGPMENTIFLNTHEGKGVVTTTQIGGDVNVGDLTDLDYWKKKLFASLSIPGQYLGDTDDNTGFNGGTSLSLISSRYAKTVKRIQNAYIQAITDAVNLILLDKGLTQYINKFSLKMQAPTTQEEKDRKENMSNSINNIQNIMNLVDGIEDTKIKLEILKSLLSSAISDVNVIASIQEEIDRLDEGGEVVQSEEGGESDFGGDFGNDTFDFENEGGMEEFPELNNESEPLEISTPAETSQPEEQFYTNNGGELLNEGDLPSFNDLNMSYTQVR